eukprot:2519938-Karenia_brevis.AAC.1
MGLHCCSLDWRVRRASLFIRLINSPPDSLQQVALISLREYCAPWYKDALFDFKLLFPTLCISVVEGRRGLLLQSSSRWSDEGVWCSLHAYNLPVDVLGHRTRTSCVSGTRHQEIEAVRRHAKSCSAMLRTTLQRQENMQRFERMSRRAFTDELNKFKT